MKYLSYLVTIVLAIFIDGSYYYLNNEAIINDSLNSGLTTNNNLETEKETTIIETELSSETNSTQNEITNNDSITSDTKNNTETNTSNNTSEQTTTNTTNSSNSNNQNDNTKDFNSIVVIEKDTNNTKNNNTDNNSNDTTSTTNNNTSSNENTDTTTNNNQTNSNNKTKYNIKSIFDNITINNKRVKEEKVTLSDGIIKNATGYSAVNNKKYLKEKANNNSNSITLLKAGEPFKILSTNINDTWWKVEYNGKIGYVENAYCFINLPDFIPSITYEITNADKSIFKSSGYNLPNVTNNKLYSTGKIYNERLGKEEYIVPVSYNFAKKIYNAQQDALEEGYSLKIYDAYRPTSVAKKVKNSLATLYNNNSTVRQNIDYSYYNGIRYTWGQNWFIAQTLSDHSLSAAIDVTLTKKGSTEDLKMPSNMHELSTKAIKYRYAVNSQTTVRNDLYAPTMTEYAKKLDKIMLNNGMNNLASEWWHFQDNQSYTTLKAIEPSGIDITFNTIVSEKY